MAFRRLHYLPKQGHTEPEHFKDKEQDDQHIKRSPLYSFETRFWQPIKI